ncbi:MAG: prolipoprotein diacylglyceryl transferase [Oscillospiraceae bacterium]|jgi:phosphatidylglycerol:prolipoprotein diacylglycerol transferase|nr:prolipoprotein diacylglyceryl transferase [Oscillospiraceae bacterium]
MSDPVIIFPIFGEGFRLNPPRAVSIFGFEIYIYGFIIAAAFLLAGAYVLKRREAFGMTRDNVMDIFLCAMIGGIVGARLYYVAFNPSEYFGAGKWLNIFRVREGGLAVYGGIILGSASIIFYGVRKKLNFARMLDAGGLGLLIGQSIGRWGNFVNREAFGSATSMPWRMGLEYSNGVTVYVHPTFLYESLWNALGLLLLHIYSKKRKSYDGKIFLLYLLWYGLGRVWIEGLRTDSLYIPVTDVRVSQLLSGLLIIASCAVLYFKWRKAQKLAISDGEEPEDEEIEETDEEEQDGESPE